MNVVFAGKVVWQGLPGSTGASGVVMSDRVGTNRNAARFYPFGDEITSTTNDRLKFATYTRDSYTGLDYANQRFYATYGRFNTPDPENGGETANPISMNLYNYVLGDPINTNDPSGLDPAPTCGSSGYYFNGAYQGTIASVLSAASNPASGNYNQAILAQTIYVESGHSSNADVPGEEDAIGAVIMNRWEFVNKDWYLFSSQIGPGSAPLSVAGWGSPGGGVASIVQAPGQVAVYQPGSSSLTASAQNNLNSAINSVSGSSACYDLAYALTVAEGDWSERSENDLYTLNGLVLTGFNSFNPPHASDGFSQSAGNFGDANTFYGVPELYTSTTPLAPTNRGGRPSPPRPPRPPRSPTQ